MEDNKTKEEIPQWILDYDKQNHQSSAGKAIRFLLQSNRQKEDRIRELEEALRLAQPYVVGAYECAFPDESENEYVRERIKSLLGE